MEAIFEVTAKKTAALPRDGAAKQVSWALEQRMELYSRERLPGLWKATDYLRSVPAASEVVLKKRRRRTILLSALCLGLGIYALIPALIEPRDPFLAVAGFAAVCLSILNLWNLQRKKKGQFDKLAMELLDKLYALPEDALLRVAFSGSDIIIEDVSSGALQNLQEIPYSELECAAETEDLYFLAYSGKGMVLPKNCLNSGPKEQFRAFLATKTTLIQR